MSAMTVSFVSSLATRVIEIKDQEVIDFQGTYDEYLANLEANKKSGKQAA